MTTKQGFSLIELLVYIGILTFLTVVVMDTLASTTRLGATESAREATTRSATVALNRLNREIKSSSSATLDNNVLVLDGNPVDLGEFIETGVNLDNLAFSLEEASTSIMIQTTLTLNGANFYSTSVLRHTQ